MRYKVLLISSGQPSLNPRLVKEADALADVGHSVTVIYAYWNDWGSLLDTELLDKKKWQAIQAGGNPDKSPITYWFSRLLLKTAKWLTKYTNSMLLAEIAIARSSYHLIREAKKHRADLYIGHNLGALPAVVKAAKKYGKPCGFDAEDFHRNEESDDTQNLDVRLKTYIEDKYIPQLQYLTASSPLISQEYQQLYPRIINATILNTFPIYSKSNVSVEHPHVPIRLFWFSQTIGFNRGLEDIIAGLQLLPEQYFQLHLLGDINDVVRTEFAGQFKAIASTIHFYNPIAPGDIMEFAAGFDIGIASEMRTPRNRDICLTNKLFTYIQAGLPLLLSGTKAQTALMQQYGVAGKIYHHGNTAIIAGALLYYHNNREALITGKKQNYQLGQTVLSWVNDKQVFLDIINQMLPGE